MYFKWRNGGNVHVFSGVFGQVFADVVPQRVDDGGAEGVTEVVGDGWGVTEVVGDI